MKAFRMVSSVSVPMHRGREHLGTCGFRRGHSWAPELGMRRQWGQRQQADRKRWGRAQCQARMPAVGAGGTDVGPRAF